MTKENLIDELVDFGFQQEKYVGEYVYKGKHISLAVEPCDFYVYVNTYISAKTYKGIMSHTKLELDDLRYMIVNEMPYNSTEINFIFNNGTFHKYLINWGGLKNERRT